MSELIEHYRREMPTPELVIRYENLVADQGGTTRQLLGHSDLAFDEACLRFHENRRYAPTPSYVQVSEKLTDRSVGRHRHYAAHLREFLPLLRPVLSAMSYEVR
jgi:hypothetical protein